MVFVMASTIPGHDLGDPRATSRILAEIAQLVEDADTPHFCETLAGLLQSHSGFDSTLMTVFFRGSAPMRIYDNLDGAFGPRLIDAYLGGAYLLDPFYALFQQAAADLVIPLADCAPDDFRQSDYFRTFYRDSGLFEECGVLVNLSRDSAVLISLGSRQPGFEPTQTGLGVLAALLPLTAVLCRRRWPSSVTGQTTATPVIGRHIERAVEAFGSSILSTREAETLQLILRGHSSKSIARVLGNSPETVRAHRKRVYAKLGVSSQGELFSAFLKAVSVSPRGFQGDPLTFSQNVVPLDEQE